MRPSSPRQTWSSNLNHTASQLFQVASPQADQRCLMWMVRKRLGNLSQVGRKCETAAWTPATTLLSYLCIDSSQCLVPWYAYFLDKGNEQCCCNLSGGVALIVWFSTNGMCGKNNTICVARASNREIASMISIVACCHGAKLCTHADQNFRSQQCHRRKVVSSTRTTSTWMQPMVL